MSEVRYVLKGAREVHRLMNSLSGRELNNRTRRAVRRGVAIGRAEIRSRAQGSEFPSTFRKTVTKYHRTPIGASTQPASPLFNIFEGGAGVHEIGKGAPNSRGTKSVLWNARAGFHAKAPVRHPGMAARPLIAPVFADKNDEMADAALAELMAGLR